MNQTKINKQEGQISTCSVCGMEIICKKFEFEGKEQLAWCDIKTNNKHFNFVPETEKTICRYLPFITKLNNILRVEMFIDSKIKSGLLDANRKELYMKLLLNGDK